MPSTGADSPSAAPANEPAQGRASRGEIRTAVIIVHGMGEQIPTQTVNEFVRSALPRSPDSHRPPRGGPTRHYYSRPAEVGDSFEARRLLAPQQPHWRDIGPDNPKIHDHFEFFEYHWSYKMQGNRLSDFVPTLRRLMVRLPARVPYGLRGAWVILWVITLTLAVMAGWFVVTRTAGQAADVNAFVAFLLGTIVAVPVVGLLTSVVMWLLRMAGNTITSYFVDVVRYLDRSPRSYAVRRDIREGMVDLLRSIHERGTYQRVIVVAHSLGGFIAYDGITSLWYEYCKAHNGQPLPAGAPFPELAGRRDLERAGGALMDAAHAHDGATRRERWRARNPRPLDRVPDDVRTLLDDYRSKQFELWKGLRAQGSPWLVTDFITFGTPMYFADLLYTKNRAQFDELVHRAELPKSPPLPQGQMVEDDDDGRRVAYTYKSAGRWVLHHAAQFAVVRWTNLYFPATGGFWGDWFGGPLRGLFGPGVLDIPILGNRGNEHTSGEKGVSSFWRNRRIPAAAHGYYFAFPEEDTRRAPYSTPTDVAPLLKRYLELTIAEELRPFLTVEDATPSTYRPKYGVQS